VTSGGAGWDAPRPLLIAHRTGNTPDQVQDAVAAGADLIEADIHLYRRRLEVRHTKTMGVLPWLWDRWYLVPAKGPRLVLAELVRSLPEDVLLMLDLKGWHQWLGRDVAKAMEAVAPGRPYAVAGRNWSMLNAFEPLDHVRIIHSAANPREAVSLTRRLARHRTDAVCIKQPLLAQDRRSSRVHDLAPVVLTWPVRSEADADTALSSGANGLIIDGVPLLERLANQHRG
jgi:glycerophosphoryl diester phosphodiesterase